MKSTNYFIVPENGQYKLYFPVELKANEIKTFYIEKDKAFKPDISIFEDFRLDEIPKHIYRPTIIRGTIIIPEDFDNDNDNGNDNDDIFVLKTSGSDILYFRLCKGESGLHYDYMVDIGLDDNYEEDYGTLQTNGKKELVYQITITGSSIDLLLYTKGGKYLDSHTICVSNFQKTLLAYALKTEYFKDIEDLCFDEILYALPYDYHYRSHIHEDFKVYQVPNPLIQVCGPTTNVYTKNTFAKPTKGFVVVENLNNITDNPLVGLRIQEVI